MFMKRMDSNEATAAWRDERLNQRVPGRSLSILYSKTRVVEPDNALLERNKIIGSSAPRYCIA